MVNDFYNGCATIEKYAKFVNFTKLNVTFYYNTGNNYCKMAVLKSGIVTSHEDATYIWAMLWAM